MRDSLLAITRLVQPSDLSVVFQPIVDLGDGHIYAMEALVRCALPEVASPPMLFANAIQARCAGRLGRMIREIAVPLCASRPIFVNVHPAELNEGWLVRPDDPIFSHDADVFVEITETVAMSHFDRCIDVVQELRARGGVYLVIDDLGAGYSNLKRIADLEPRIVKIDRGVVENIDRSPRVQKLVAAIVRLCADLGADVCCEGIETPAELAAVRDAGARFGQGYLFARPSYPIPAASIPPLLSLPPTASFERARARVAALTSRR